MSDKNANPLVGTSVYLTDPKIGVLCNQEGDYVLNTLPIDKVFIQLTYLSYNTEVVAFVVQRGVNRLNFNLKEIIVEVQEFVVSGGMVSALRNNTVKFSYYYMQELGMIYPFVLPLINERNRRNNIWYQDPHHHLVALQNKLYLGKLRFDINVAWQGNVRRAYAKTPTPFVERRLNTLTYETKVHLPSNENSDCILGIQGMEQTNRNINDRAKKRMPDADISRFSALFFTQHTYYKLKLEGGLRIDYSSVESFGSGEEGTEKYRAPVSEYYFSPNESLGATYRLSDETTLRINFAKACRMPYLRETLVTGLVGSRYEIAGKNLKPEEAYEGDFSFHYNGNSLSVDAAVFYNYINMAPTGENTPKELAVFKTSQNYMVVKLPCIILR